MTKKVSPEFIENLGFNQVFVFGSNESGIHGAGAAYLAYKNFGAPYGLGFGFYNSPLGKTFAIPTKDWDVTTLSLPVIQFYVNRFIDFAKKHPGLDFLVTQIGCGLAGYSVHHIAPLFKKAILVDNIYLPLSFINHLNNAERTSTVY